MSVIHLHAVSPNYVGVYSILYSPLFSGLVNSPIKCVLHNLSTKALFLCPHLSLRTCSVFLISYPVNILNTS